MQRKAGQLSLADGLVRGANNFLAEADALIDWREIEQQLEGIYNASTGRPSYPLLTLFKAMLLQQWYGLSDPRTEEAMNDSISFRRFVGLSLSDSVPDHSTLSRFRAQLGNRLGTVGSVQRAIGSAGIDCPTRNAHRCVLHTVQLPEEPGRQRSAKLWRTKRRQRFGLQDACFGGSVLRIGAQGHSDRRQYQ